MTSRNWKQLYERMLDLQSRNAAKESAGDGSCKSEIADSEETSARQNHETLQVPEDDADSPKNADSLQLEMLQSIQEQLVEIHESISDNAESTQIIFHQSETLQEVSKRLHAVEDDHFSDHVLRPMLHDLILLYDGVIRTRRSMVLGLKENSKDLDVEGPLRGFEKELLDMLARHDVSLMRDTNQKLDPKKQKVVGIKETDNIKGGEFLSEVRPGFYWNKSVLRYQEVIVHRSKIKEY